MELVLFIFVCAKCTKSEIFCLRRVNSQSSEKEWIREKKKANNKTTYTAVNIERDEIDHVNK